MKPRKTEAGWKVGKYEIRRTAAGDAIVRGDESFTEFVATNKIGSHQLALGVAERLSVDPELESEYQWTAA